MKRRTVLKPAALNLVCIGAVGALAAGGMATAAKPVVRTCRSKG